MDNDAAPRKPPMAEEAPGEMENAAQPDTRAEEAAVQESFESPPSRARREMADMVESDEDTS
jgi:hypothetical protein